MPKLENWGVERNCLVGNIFNDEKGRFDDGDCVRTSTIFSIDFQEMVAETKNTIYKLGKMSESYAKYLESFIDLEKLGDK